MKIASMMGDLMTRGEGKPADTDLTALPAHEAFAAAPWDEDWKEAGLKEVLIYLRGNKSLRLPQIWRDVIPRSL